MSYDNFSRLKGTHAFLSPSQSAWLRYSDEKLTEAYLRYKAKEMGTRFHAWAEETIKLGIKQPRSKRTIYNYVNDAIGFRMEPEQVLYYSDNCYGTADAICFRNKQLRIHDLKTGETPAHMEQLEIYAALFCLQNHIKPEDIEMELRLYQSNDIRIENPTASDIGPIMDEIVHKNEVLERFKKEQGLE